MSFRRSKAIIYHANFHNTEVDLPRKKRHIRQPLLYLLAAVLSASMVGVAATAGDVDVYVLAGQSNMDGRGLIAELVSDHPQAAGPRSDIRFWYANTAGKGYSTGWVDLAPGFGVPPKFIRKNGRGGNLPSKTFGPEIAFGPAMLQHRPGRQVAIIKVTRGGTNLRKDWAATEDPAGPMYQLLVRTVNDALGKLSEAGDTGHLRGVLWHQGEGDRKSSKYAQRLEVFIDRLRKDLDKPQLPFVIGAVFDNGKRDIIREQQRVAVEAVAYTAYVPSEGLETFEGTHFTTASTLELGERFAQAIQQLQTEDPEPAQDVIEFVEPE